LFDPLSSFYCSFLGCKNVFTARSLDLDLEGRTIWIVDAHGYGKRFIVRADEIPTAFLELQRATHAFAM
jgi:hypothetical protein